MKNKETKLLRKIHKNKRHFYATGLLAALTLGFLLSRCLHQSGIRLPKEDTPQGARQAMLYRQNCAICHSLPHPRRHTKARWEHLMRIMQMHRENRGMGRLDPESYEAILNYLKRHGR